ncbi:E3 ubiquitin- ligase makorin-1, partial [Brachionus plicatilis]
CLFGDDCFYAHPSREASEPAAARRVKSGKLLEERLTEEEPKPAQAQAPSSYFEALTGKQLAPEPNDLDLCVFDPAHTGHLKRQQTNAAASSLCPYFEKSLECPFASSCQYMHGEVCDVCSMACLHPFDSAQRDQHRKECVNQVEKEMEEAFAVQRSNERQCGICMETVWDKEKVNDRRFGILENCNHCFCLQCIRQWRASKSYENKIVKACPECRVKSDYVTPSKYWFDNEEEKKKIISDYKSNLGKTECKYYKRGEGTCPFGSNIN